MAAAAALLFVLIVAWLHVARRDINPVARGVSRYAGGPTLVPMTVGFLSLAAAMAIVAVRFPGRGAAGSFWVAAIGLVVVALTPSDTRGPIGRFFAHTIGGLVFFAAAAIASVLASARLPMTARLTAWLLGAAVAAFFAGIAGAPGLAGVRGLLQRACFLLVVLWICLVSLRGWAS